ncbi:MAG: alginate export family protein [Pseudomonadota bacterium]
MRGRASSRVAPKLLAAALGVLINNSWAETPSAPKVQLPSFIAQGSAELDFRYRYEWVDQDGFNSRAKASLLRSRLTLESGPIGPFAARFEIDNVANVGPADYNSTENGKVDFPTVADPQGTDINQAFLKLATPRLEAGLGRQRIVLGDRRFIGSKPWRNNEQTYDGGRLLWKASTGLSFDASYVARVNRIFGPDDGFNPADWRGDSVLLRSDYRFSDRQQLAAFLYALDVDAQAGFSAAQTVNNSSHSVGLEYHGEFSGVKLRSALAIQRDAGESELSYRADYYVVELHAPYAGLEFKAAYEVLGADNGVGFATPLANGHRYQGWADRFLATPADGLKDAWVSVNGRIGAVALTGRYHDFRAESSSETFGRELDLQAQWSVNDYLTATLKTAVFASKAPGRYPDTTKAWLIMQLRF